MSLSNLVKEHTLHVNSLKSDNDRKKSEAIKSSTNVSNLLVEGLNKDVSEIFLRQKQIESEIKSLQASIGVFSTQSSSWLSMIEGFNKSLKGIGDLETWSRVIETDMEIVEKTLEFLAKDC